MIKPNSPLAAYCQLMRLNKPIGILLLLWPTLWALWIAAQGMPSPKILAVFVLGVIVMRAAGCVINDIADRKFDGNVERTQNRPLAKKIIPVKNALILFAILCAIALVLLLCLNFYAIILGVIGFFLTLIYPWTKRFTHWPQAFLGLAFAWGIPMAFAAENNAVPPPAWGVFALTFLWILAYDTEYAMADRRDDLLIGVKSTAILFGRFDRLIIAALQAMILLGFCILADHLNLGVGFYIGWAAALMLAVYQQYLIREREPNGCFRAFLNNHWFGLALFAGIVFGI